MTFEELAQKLTPRLRDAFLAAIRDIRDNAILGEVIAAVEANDIDRAMRALGLSPAVFNDFGAVLAQTFREGGALLVSQLPKYSRDTNGVRNMIRFNMRDRRAEDWLINASSTMITRLEDDTRDTVRATLQESLASGRNPRRTALDIVGRYDRRTGSREGGLVGLSEREEIWSRSFRQKLVTLDDGYFNMTLRDKRFDPTVRKAIESGQPLTQDTIDKLVSRYRSNALQERGNSIARTETLAALNRSEWLATKQALEKSGLPDDAAYKVWDSAADSRTRPSHRKLDGVRIPINEAFTSPTSGKPMMHPGDDSMGATGEDVIGCRCRVRYEIDFFAGFKNGTET